MAESFTLDAQLRTDFGTQANRRVRRIADQIPAVIYGGGAEPQNLLLEHRKVSKALENEAFYSHILTIKIDGKTQKAVIKDMQRHPFKPKILHMDFLRVTGKEKITMRVPLHFVGGDVAPGVKTEGGVISHLLTEVEINCLPDDLPEYLEIDVSHLELNQSLHLSDIPLPKGVEIVELSYGPEHDLPIANVHIPRAVIEEEAPAEEEALEGEEAVAEGEEVESKEAAEKESADDKASKKES